MNRITKFRIFEEVMNICSFVIWCWPKFDVAESLSDVHILSNLKSTHSCAKQCKSPPFIGSHICEFLLL